MVTNDATLVRLKHRIMEETAKLAWEGILDEEHKEKLIYEIIPGPMATYRCCVYKEREITRQRIKLVEGKCPGTKESNNIVQVISSACEECPISRYVVTDNCQKCMAKRCQQACNFGAVSMGRDRAYIDPSKCKECGFIFNPSVTSLKRSRKILCPKCRHGRSNQETRRKVPKGEGKTEGGRWHGFLDFSR